MTALHNFLVNVVKETSIFQCFEYLIMPTTKIQSSSHLLIHNKAFCVIFVAGWEVEICCNYNHTRYTHSVGRRTQRQLQLIRLKPTGSEQQACDLFHVKTHTHTQSGCVGYLYKLSCQVVPYSMHMKPGQGRKRHRRQVGGGESFFNLPHFICKK